jgi:hypothetical protein
MNYKILHLISLLLIGLLFQSCLMLERIKTEDDIVNSSRRIKAEFNYYASQEWDSPLILVNQKIVKEIKQNSVEQYKVYDLIKLKSNSFKLDNKVFIIVDSVPFSLEVEYYDSKMIQKIDEKRKEILTSDSTKVSVLTGYDENQIWDYRLVYYIDKSIIGKIKSSQNVMLRYYAGPDMISIKLGKKDLDILKKIIEMN